MYYLDIRSILTARYSLSAAVIRSISTAESEAYPQRHAGTQHIIYIARSKYTSHPQALRSKYERIRRHYAGTHHIWSTYTSPAVYNTGTQGRSI